MEGISQVRGKGEGLTWRLLIGARSGAYQTGYAGVRVCAERGRTGAWARLLPGLAGAGGQCGIECYLFNSYKPLMNKR